MATKIKIIETGQIEEFKLIDTKTGSDYFPDWQPRTWAAEGFERDEEEDAYLLTQYQYNWWAEVVDKQTRIDDATEEILRRHPEKDEEINQALMKAWESTADLDEAVERQLECLSTLKAELE